MPEPRGIICLGMVDDGTGQYEKAAEQFQQAVQLDPTNDAAYRGLAGAYQRLNQPDKAEETYKRAISLRPQYWRGYHVLGVFYWSRAEYEKAVAMCRKGDRAGSGQLSRLQWPGGCFALRWQRRGRGYRV